MSWLSNFLRRFRTKPQPPIEPPRPPQGNDATQCVEEINRERQQRGLEPLSYHPCLANQAQQHAQHMQRTRTMSHAGFSARLNHCGIGTGSENVAAGYGEPATVVDGWMKSPGHRANILKPSYRRIGVGCVGGYWCALFAA